MATGKADGGPADAEGLVYFNAPGVASVRWDPEAEAVLVGWEGWADSTEFAAMLNAGIRALKEHHGSRWLADCRLQKVLNQADQEWGDRDWMPRALAAGLKRFAIVLPKSGLATMNIQDSLAKAAVKTLQVAYFETVEEARQWLLEAGPS